MLSVPAVFRMQGAFNKFVWFPDRSSSQVCLSFSVRTVPRTRALIPGRGDLSSGSNFNGAAEIMANETNQLVVIAHFEAKPGKEKELEDLFRGLLLPTRAESGCLRYELNHNLDDPRRFTFAEKFRNEEAFQEHPKTPHVRHFLDVVPALIASKEVRTLKELFPGRERPLQPGESPFVVIAHFTPKPGKRVELLSFLSSLIEPTRAEPGCSRYELNQDLADSDTFSFVETFAGKAGFDAHCQQPYIAKLFEVLPVLVDKQVIGLHRQINVS
jgi:quinol monooxygenase YgiN